jgi:hypothetical protein
MSEQELVWRAARKIAQLRKKSIVPSLYVRLRTHASWRSIGFSALGWNMQQIIDFILELVHDIGEIDTGDTMVFVEGGWEERKATELAAVTRIFGLLPEAQRAEFMTLWKEFEHGETSDARFANAADRAMPVLLNLANAGQSWRENGISYERVVARVGLPIEVGCPALWDYLQSRLEEARGKGWFGAWERPVSVAEDVSNSNAAASPNAVRQPQRGRRAP